MEPTLGQLVHELQPAVLSVAVAPAGLDVAVRDPVVYDPRGDDLGAGDILLAVGADGRGGELTGLISRAGRAAAAAVVVRPTSALPQEVLDHAETVGVAVLVAQSSTAWGQLYTLLRTVTAAPSGDEAGGGLPIGDLFALADAVAASVGGATTIEDPYGRVLAYSSLDFPIDAAREETILGRRVSAAWLAKQHAAGHFRRLWGGEGVVRVEFPDEPEVWARLAVAVRAGGEVLGSIWVVQPEQPFPPGAEERLLEAAQLAALHLLRHRNAADLERVRRSEALRAVLAGTAGPADAQVLGLTAGSRYAVVAFRVLDAEDGGEGDDADIVIRASRAADLVALHCESYRRRAACLPIGGTVLALIPDVADDQRLMALARAAGRRAQEALHVRLVVGIGSTVDDLTDAPRSRRDAEAAAAVLARGGVEGMTVAHISQVRSQAILAETLALMTDRPHLFAGPVAALAASDREKLTAYIPTLRAYLDAFGDMNAAAAAVNVHPNTFRYRVRRLGEISGLDLDDPVERLVAELQLRLLPP